MAPNHNNTLPHTPVEGKYPIVIVGAGRMGLSIANMLSSDARFTICMVDPVEEAAKKAELEGFEVLEFDATNEQKMAAILKNAFAVVVAAPSSVVVPVARLAVRTGCHHIDLCEDTSVLDEVIRIGSGVSSILVPQCGLAPGFVSSLAGDIIRDSGDDAQIRVYVGILPTQKTNRLGYGNIWSIDGLITEYTKPCRAIVSGEKTELPPLSAYEELMVDGVSFEAFTTSGGLDGLIDKFEGKVKSLVFKTLRYTGHLDYMKFLIEDLGLERRIDFLKNLLSNGLSAIDQDRVVIGVISKYRNRLKTGNPLTEHSHFQFIQSRQHGDGSYTSAISIATAAHACCILDILSSGLAPHEGLLHHDEIDLSLLQKSCFYKHFAPQ